MPEKVLILPGFASSGPEHWQSLWEQKYPAFERLCARDWYQPVCDEWVQTLATRIAELGTDLVLVAHSLGCLQVAHWASRSRTSVRGALLVAPPNPEGAVFPIQARGFAPVPSERLPFPSIVVASTNDPYADLSYAKKCAEMWGSRFVNIGAAGHINAESRLGGWPEGLELLTRCSELHC